jgi:hypothetical protein
LCGALVDAVFHVHQTAAAFVYSGVARGDALHAGHGLAMATEARFAIAWTGLTPKLLTHAQPKLCGVTKLIGLQGLHIFARKVQARFHLI